MINKFGDEVQISDNQVRTALNSGYTYVNQPAQPSAGASKAPTSSPYSPGQRIYGAVAEKAARDAGYTLINGRDVGSSWPSYEVGQKTTGQQPGQQPQDINKIIIDTIAEYAATNPPKVTSQLSQGEMDLYLKQAQERVNPEFAEYFEQARQDVLSGFQQLGQDLQTSERKLQSDFGSQLERTQENLASRGLTFSSIRDEAEKTLQESTQAAIDAGRREAERRALSLGTAAERKLGSANLPALPGVDTAPQPIIGTPGEFIFSKPTGTRSLYSPTGGQTGELKYKKIGATGDLYNQYLRGERELRGITKTA